MNDGDDELLRDFYLIEKYGGANVYVSYIDSNKTLTTKNKYSQCYFYL